MGLYNFQDRFVPFILDGRKRHTIRAKRKNPDKPGNTLYLYRGLRRKGAKLLMRVPCVKVQEILIDTPYPDHEVMLPWDVTVTIDGVGLGADELERLASADGFRSWEEMVCFWDGRLPFEGHIIHWK